MKTLELPFTTLEIHDGYVIGRTKEGVHMSMKEHMQVLDSVNQHLTSPYAFILDEVNSYSIDLHVLLHVHKDKNIFCIGVVYYRTATKIALEFGKHIIKKPVYFSKNINHVEEWVKKQIAR